MPRPHYPAKNGNKFCWGCETIKSVQDFYNDSRHEDNLNTRCKICRNKYVNNLYSDLKSSDKLKRTAKNYKLKERYRITLEEKEILLINQNYCCAICHIHFDGQTQNTKAFVDHCHVTNKVRGLLCNNCNFALGGFKDNENSLLTAIEYLRKNK